MKACADCKFHRSAPFSAVHMGPSYMARFPMCVHPSRRQEHPVYKTLLLDRHCVDARADEKDCGPEGRMFEPSLRYRIITALFGKGDDQ